MGEIAMLVEGSGTWPVIVGIGCRGGEWLRGEGWNIEEEESREILNIQTI